MHLDSSHIVTPSSVGPSMNPTHFEALTHQIAQLTTQLGVVQANLTAAHQENRDLASRVKTLEFSVHPYDAKNFDALHHRHHRDSRDGGMHYRCDRRHKDHDREQDRYHHGNKSPPRHEKQLFKTIKQEAPTFNGSLNPGVYTYWIRDMDHFFKQYGVSKDRRVEFASLKFVGNAQFYQESIEDLLLQRHVPPVRAWVNMKHRLQEKYILQSYMENFIDQWNAHGRLTGP